VTPEVAAGRLAEGLVAESARRDEIRRERAGRESAVTKVELPGDPPDSEQRRQWALAVAYRDVVIRPGREKLVDLCIGGRVVKRVPVPRIVTFSPSDEKEKMGQLAREQRQLEGEIIAAKFGRAAVMREGWL
jgi:hypothetical protein